MDDTQFGSFIDQRKYLTFQWTEALKLRTLNKTTHYCTLFNVFPQKVLYELDYRIKAKVTR